MKTLRLKSHRFRAEREAAWKELEALLDKFEKGRAVRLSDEEIIALPFSIAPRCRRFPSRGRSRSIKTSSHISRV